MVSRWFSGQAPARLAPDGVHASCPSASTSDSTSHSRTPRATSSHTARVDFRRQTLRSFQRSCASCRRARPSRTKSTRRLALSIETRTAAAAVAPPELLGEVDIASSSTCAARPGDRVRILLATRIRPRSSVIKAPGSWQDSLMSRVSTPRQRLPHLPNPSNSSPRAASPTSTR